MIASILQWLIKSKGVKVGGTLLGGGSMVALLLGAHADITTKIEKQDERQKEYVQLMLKPIETEMRHLKEETKETKGLVRDIHNYLLKNKGR